MPSVMTAIKANLSYEYIYNDDLVIELTNYVKMNERLDKHAFSEMYNKKLGAIFSDAPLVFNTLVNGGVYTIYGADGLRAPFSDINVVDNTYGTKEESSFKDFSEAYHWAVLLLDASGTLKYSEVNSLLGSYKSQVYKALATNPKYKPINGGLALAEPDVKEAKKSKQEPIVAPTHKTCAKCNNDLPMDDFHMGRNVCKTCYNNSRRATKSVSLPSISKEVSKLNRDFEVAQKKAFRNYVEAMETLQDEYRNALQELLESADNSDEE